MTQTSTDEPDTIAAHSIDTPDGELAVTLLSDDTIVLDVITTDHAATAVLDLDTARELHARLGALLYAADYPA